MTDTQALEAELRESADECERRQIMLPMELMLRAADALAALRQERDAAREAELSHLIRGFGVVTYWCEEHKGITVTRAAPPTGDPCPLCSMRARADRAEALIREYVSAIDAGSGSRRFSALREMRAMLADLDAEKEKP